MGKYTGISWCHHTFNTHIGCSKISEGCESCYAWADMDLRRHRVTWGPRGTRSVTSESYWRQPFAWNQAAIEAGERRRVFCASLADIFEVWDGGFVDAHKRPAWEVNGRWVATEGEAPGERLTIHHIRARLWKTILATPYLDWLLLTKRPENVLPALKETWQHMKARCFDDGCLTAWIDGSYPPTNVWLGTTVENQKWADERIPVLSRTPARVRFLSCEPLLEFVDLFRECGTASIDWVIVGGESDQGGKEARPFDLGWARSIVRQCRDAGVACFMKQLGSSPVETHVRDYRANPSPGIHPGIASLTSTTSLVLRDRSGSDPAEWPDDLRIRELPREVACA